MADKGKGKGNGIAVPPTEENPNGVIGPKGKGKVGTGQTSESWKAYWIGYTEKEVEYGRMEAGELFCYH